jgi:hypothetical protein
LNTTKVALGLKFDSLTNISEVEIRRWLTDFIVGNVEHNLISKEQRGTLCEIEKEISALRVREEITMGPLGDYIKKWVNQAIVVVSKATKT